MKIRGSHAALMAAFLLAALISGCGLMPSSSNDLDGTSWTLESYAGQALIPDSTMTAVFNGGEVSGSASCNHYFAAYQTQGDRIAIEGLGWTEMACLEPEGIMSQEQEIMRLLGSASAYKLQGEQLIIIVENGSQLVFNTQPAD
jgi:heat shock protein HslJ